VKSDVDQRDTAMTGRLRAALARRWTVVTNNIREFRLIEGLACADWTLAAP
jgi:predicted nucleic acid-binding protein